MIDKLNLAEIVRYLFSGIVILAGIGIARRISFVQVEEFIMQHPWIKETGPVALIVTLTLLIGYISFGLYRNLVYEFPITELKGFFSKILKLKTYRGFINDLRVEYRLKRTNNRNAERLYAVIKSVCLRDLYKDTGTTVATHIHLLYFTSIVILIATCFSQAWLAASISMIGFLFVILIDFQFEKFELYLIQTQQAKVREVISNLKI